MQNTPRTTPNDGSSAIPSLPLADAPSDDGASWRRDPNVVTMERLRDGDMEAFRVLFLKYNGAIADFAYGFLRSRGPAEEIAQTVFLNLFRARENYRPR